jgi:hypothetical protein
MQPEPTVLAYLAGIFDADGYITINRSVRKGRVYHGPQVGIAGTRRQPHDLAASIWGGNINRYVPKNPRHRPQYQWTRQGASAIVVIEAIRPYLLVKADQAALAIDLWDDIQDGKDDDPFPWAVAGYDPVPSRDALRKDVMALNQSRNRGSVAAGRTLDGRTHDEWPV